MRQSVRLIGVGSHHGDDQVGWLALETAPLPACRGVAAETVAEPLQLIDLLPGIEVLILVDGCRAGSPRGHVRCFRWPFEEADVPGLVSSHGLGLVGALRLAEALGRLPRVVWLIGIEVGECQPGSGPGADVREAVARIGDRVERIVRIERRASLSAAGAQRASPGAELPSGSTRGVV